MRETESNLTQLRTFSAHMKAWSVFTLFVLASACGQINNNSTSSLMTDCLLNTDQAATLRARWLQPAVPIAFHAGDWNASEISAMVAAADKWNSFFAASMGYPAIDYGSASSPRTSSAALPTDLNDFCNNQSIVNTDGTFSGPVVIYKDGTWPSAYDSGYIALTSTCDVTVSSTKKIVQRRHNAYLEINYANFFVNGNRVPDLQSIVLHEMGHIMGLGHSCETNSTTTGIPNCNSGILNATYRSASMYPTFTFYTNGTGEVRRSLNSNDQGRVNCIYKFL